MTSTRLAAIERDGREQTALVVQERLAPLELLAPERAELHGGLMALLERWDERWPAIRSLAERPDSSLLGLDPRDPSIRLLPPVRIPGAMFCVVDNYRGRFDDGDPWRAGRPDGSPIILPKPPHCIVGAGEAIELPAHARVVRCGVELGVVIGRRCRGVFARDALDCVAGYTILNRVWCESDGWSGQRPGGSDWLADSCFDSSSPMGPYLLPRELMPGHSHARLRLLHNGRVRQDASASSMRSSVQELIQLVSAGLTLRPGDVIATGTPEWIDGRSDGLQAGDEVVCEIEGIGALRNPVIGPLMMVPPASQGTAYA